MGNSLFHIDYYFNVVLLPKLAHAQNGLSLNIHLNISVIISCARLNILQKPHLYNIS